MPLAVALLASRGVAALAGRSSRDTRAAAAAALWSGLIGGLLAFIVWVTRPTRTTAGPTTPQMLRDFHRSGSHDLVAYAVGDNLGAALGPARDHPGGGARARLADGRVMAVG